MLGVAALCPLPVRCSDPSPPITLALLPMSVSRARLGPACPEPSLAAPHLVISSHQTGLPGASAISCCGSYIHRVPVQRCECRPTCSPRMSSSAFLFPLTNPPDGSGQAFPGDCPFVRDARLGSNPVSLFMGFLILRVSTPCSRFRGIKTVQPCRGAIADPRCRTHRCFLLNASAEHDALPAIAVRSNQWTLIRHTTQA